MEDSKIIDLFFARNEDAIKHTNDTYGWRLYHLADNILQNGQDAEESVSDTYMKAWNTIPPQRPLHFFAYIARICRNFALKRLDWKNAQKRKAEVVALTQEMENCIPDPVRDREVEAMELGRILDAFLRTLTPDNQMVFIVCEQDTAFITIYMRSYYDPNSSKRMSPRALEQVAEVLDFSICPIPMEAEETMQWVPKDDRIFRMLPL